MFSKAQNYIAGFAIFLLIVILGCASFQAALTPCYISKAAAKYAKTKTTSIFPWTTLFDAQRVEMNLDYVHTMNQITDTLKYEYHKGITRFHKAAGEELRAALFDPKGSIGTLITSTLGIAVGGLLLSKPKDRKKIKKLEKQNNTAKPAKTENASPD